MENLILWPFLPLCKKRVCSPSSPLTAMSFSERIKKIVCSWKSQERDRRMASPTLLLNAEVSLLPRQLGGCSATPPNTHPIGRNAVWKKYRGLGKQWQWTGAKKGTKVGERGGFECFNTCCNGNFDRTNAFWGVFFFLILKQEYPTVKS